MIALSEVAKETVIQFKATVSVFSSSLELEVMGQVDVPAKKGGIYVDVGGAMIRVPADTQVEVIHSLGPPETPRPGSARVVG